MKYEIDDKGQDFIRCAVKTTQLLNVLHLSLPDNLLGFKEAQLIASMINKNTPLKILNLSRNSFDFESAAIIGDSLLSNSNLKSLDMSYNRMGDTGIRNLLYPLLMIGLK
jgi:Ran GTPase-activating protein (RanGAP) involved in mRNA processing and transport